MSITGAHRCADCSEQFVNDGKWGSSYCPPCRRARQKAYREGKAAPTPYCGICKQANKSVKRREVPFESISEGSVDMDVYMMVPNAPLPETKQYGYLCSTCDSFARLFILDRPKVVKTLDYLRDWFGESIATFPLIPHVDPHIVLESQTG